MVFGCRRISILLNAVNQTQCRASCLGLQPFSAQVDSFVPSRDTALRLSVAQPRLLGNIEQTSTRAKPLYPVDPPLHPYSTACRHHETTKENYQRFLFGSGTYPAASKHNNNKSKHTIGTYCRDYYQRTHPASKSSLSGHPVLFVCVNLFCAFLALDYDWRAKCGGAASHLIANFSRLRRKQACSLERGAGGTKL